jgi:general secretion pathway protein D
MPARLTFLLPITLSGVLLTSCASSSLENIQSLLNSGQDEAAMGSLTEEMQKHPDDKDIRFSYFQTRDKFIARTLTAAERARSMGGFEEAEKQARLALKFDLENQRALALLRNVDADKKRSEKLVQAQKLLDAMRMADAESVVRAVIAESPNDHEARALLRKIDEQTAVNQPINEDKTLKGANSTPITLEFRDTPLRNVFEAISRTAGINFVFDKDVKPDTRVTVFVRNTNIDEVMRLILTTNQLDRKILNENSVIIYPATPAKQKDYQDLATRTFYLTNTDAKQAQAMIKAVVKTRDTFIDEGLNILVIKDTPDAIRMAEKLITQFDLPAPEVMLDVEVLEIERSKALALGIQYPDQVGYGILQPTTTSTTTTTTGTTTSTNLGGALQSGYVNLKQSSAMVPYISNPGFELNLKDQLGVSNTLANPHIRVRNKEKAKIHIGDKVPVFTTTSTANVGVSASVNYLDVGLMLDVEPTVRLDDNVEIKVGLEVSSISKEITGPQSSLAYQIGTRTANTVLRLQDGETQVLAGLISDAERNSVISIPGLGSIPALGRLFSSHSNTNSKTEIVLLITPHVIRNITPAATSRAALPAGTDTAAGVPPLIISTRTPPGSLNIRGGAGAAGNASNLTMDAQIPRNTPQTTNAPITESSTATFTLSSPPSVRPGQAFSATISLSATSEIQSAEVELSWDPKLFESAVPANGNPLKLIVSGNSATADIGLKAKEGGNGEGQISLKSQQVTLKTGKVDQATLPAPAIVKVTP